MISFYDLDPNFRAVFLGIVFTELCISIVLLQPAVKRKRLFPRLFLPFSVVSTLGLVILYGTNMKSTLLGFEEIAVCKWFCEQPVIFAFINVIAVLIILVCIIIKEIQYRKNTITRSSVKESLDKLSTGLCFSFENGKPVLVNHKMNELHYKLFDEDLQNADAFWHRLIHGTVNEDVECIHTDKTPCYRLSDGTVWSFSMKMIPGFVQITAADTTQLYNVNKELEAKNIELTALNERLKNYGANVDEFIRSKERLETKINIHRELGQSLLATRKYLQNESEVAPIEIWKKNISVLRKEANLPTEDPYEMFLQAADTIGVKLEVDGTLPEDIDIRNLFVSAAVEALTNAVRHGRAKTLFIKSIKTSRYYKVIFKNDGYKPQTPIIEGGGLSSLRNKIQRANGEMSVLSQPEFELTVVVRKS